MGSSLRVWFPNGFMENCRDQGQVDQLLAALRAEGVECSTDPEPEAARGAQLAFAGTWRYYPETAAVRRLFPGLPVVHYNWDLYPFQVNDRTDPRTDRTRRARPTVQATRWGEYVEELKHATEVLVPSSGVVRRTEEFTGRSARVAKCCAFPWDPPENTTVRNDEYVMDVMREYSGEPMCGAVADACREVGVEYVAKGHRMSWVEFQTTVCRAGLLVSAYNEASTGGLTLLEGYALGKDVLVSDHPLQGANEYFGRRAHTFDHRTGRVGLREAIKTLTDPGKTPSDAEKEDRRRWVEREYGVAVFARRLAAEFRRVANGNG